MSAETSAYGILNQANTWLSAGKRVALATVIRTWGSSPRPVGSQLAIADDGSFAGSVSGGCIEGVVVERAQSVISEGAPEVMQFTVSNDDALNVGLTCGGKLDVLVAAVCNGDILDQLCVDLKNRIPVCLLTDMVDGSMSLLRMARRTCSPVLGSVSNDHIPSLLRSGESRVLSGSEDDRIFALSLLPSPRCYIIGAGHIAQALAPMAKIAGFSVGVVDPRTAFATETRFPETDIYAEWPDSFFEHTPIDSNTAIVTLVHDSKIDDPALEAALKSDAFYIGALGSRKTHEKRCRRFLEKGSNSTDLKRIHAPVGLNLGGRKPPEIAVSIIADVVQAWNTARS